MPDPTPVPAPKPAGKFTMAEAFADLPQAVALVQKISEGVSALPKGTALKAKDYADLVVLILPDLAELIDTIRTQAND